MRVDLSYLPHGKQAELTQIVALIQAMIPTEMVILFGSYARNTWVEDKYDEAHYRYQSDFDILAVIADKSEFVQAKLERDLEAQIDQDTTIHTPVSILVHDIDFVNRRLMKGQYFFTDIKKEGILLQDSGQFQLKEAKELLPTEQKKLAQEDFEYYFDKANGFKKGVGFYLEEKDLNNAAFLLHQTTEQLYAGILLVFTRYKPNSHDLALLRKLANSLDDKFARIFPFDNADNKHLFKLLRKAYIDARYKRDYKIAKEELQKIMVKVDRLKKIGAQLCQDKIDSFN